MYLLAAFPILSLILFSIAPIIGGLIGYNSINEIEDEDERKREEFRRARNGVLIGLVIDIPFLWFVLYFFSVM